MSACTGRQAKTPDGDRSKAIDELGKSVVGERGVPGLAVAVIRDDKPFKTIVLGAANLATHEPVSTGTPFQLASTTKIFSSVGVLLLVADGKAQLDDPIGKYLDSLPSGWAPVTIRQLLSHTSGLPDIAARTGEIDLVAQDWDRALPIIAKKSFAFRPGTSWTYNQTNYALLLRLIERISGVRFEDFLSQRLFQPLGMRNTFYPDPQHKCAVNYKKENDGRIVERPELAFPHYVRAAGGLCSSLGDMIVWSDALDSGKIIPRALLDKAWSPTKLVNGSSAQVGGPISYGLGWAIDTTANHRWVGHSGGNSTAFRRYLDDHLTVIVLQNGTNDPDALVSSLAHAMLDKPAAGGSDANLWDAASDGNAAAVEAALRDGANVNALDTRSSRNGRYALNWAAINDHADVIRLLLANGAAIDAQNLTGFTALHHAAESGSALAAQALLTAGANTSIRTANGETAAEVARRNGNSAVAALIDRHARKT